MMYQYLFCVFFFKQKTAYEMRISDWSSDVCSSDLAADGAGLHKAERTLWREPSDRQGSGGAAVGHRATLRRPAARFRTVHPWRRFDRPGFSQRLCGGRQGVWIVGRTCMGRCEAMAGGADRKSTRLNSSH